MDDTTPDEDLEELERLRRKYKVKDDQRVGTLARVIEEEAENEEPEDSDDSDEN